MGLPNLDPPERERLTERQQLLLLHIACGDTVSAAGRKAGYSSGRDVMRGLRERLGARSATHAVVIAAGRGLLTCEPRKYTQTRYLPTEQRATIREHYPSVDFGVDEWVDFFDREPEVYHSLLRAIGRGGIRRKEAA